MALEAISAPNTPILYAGLTRDSAKEAVWDMLLTLLTAIGIPYEARLSTLQITFPNGSKITLFGCDQQNARNRLRGRKFKLICFDETAFLSALDPLVHAVLPMLADFAGTLCLTSSPGEVLQGLFYQADQGNQQADWSRYHWTLQDNPHFQGAALDPKYPSRAEEEFDLVCRHQYGGNREHPNFRREWLGLWVADHTSLVYPIGPQNSLADAGVAGLSVLPHPEYVIGLEMGAPLTHSLIVAQFSEYSREFRVIANWESSDLDPDALAGRVSNAIAYYNPLLVVAHLGKYSEDVLSEFKRRSKLSIQGVQFTDRDKQFYQKIVATDLLAGHIKISPNLPLVAQCATIVRDDAGFEIEGQPNFSAHAFLCAYLKIYQTHLQHFTPPLTMEERHLAQLERPEETIFWTDR